MVIEVLAMRLVQLLTASARLLAQCTGEVKPFRRNEIYLHTLMRRKEEGGTVKLLRYFIVANLDRDGSWTLAELTRYIQANFR